jgi:peptidoglycan hydrolase-like protein with peptidoglycan-binding domain
MDKEKQTPKKTQTPKEYLTNLNTVPSKSEEVAKPAEPIKSETPPPAPKKVEPSVPKTAYAVVSGKEKDEVHLSKAIYKNMARKRSLTVHHIQRRLHEWGHFDAFLDKDGFYGDHTKKSVTEFQDRMGIFATGLMDEATMNKLFEGDTNVIVYNS